MKKILSFFKIGDYVIVVLVLALAVFMLVGSNGSPFSNDKGRLMMISGEKETILQWKNTTYSIYDETGKRMIIQIDGDNRRARVVSSDCPDKLCVHSGWVSACGHIAACLPNGVLLMIDCQGDGYDFNITKPE